MDSISKWGSATPFGLSFSGCGVKSTLDFALKGCGFSRTVKVAGNK
jgi:hypothetical protein